MVSFVLLNDGTSNVLLNDGVSQVLLNQDGVAGGDDQVQANKLALLGVGY